MYTLFQATLALGVSLPPCLLGARGGAYMLDPFGLFSSAGSIPRDQPSEERPQ